MSRTNKRIARRTRDYVLPKEVDRMLTAVVDTGRHGQRNYTMILLCYRHGLRLGELMDLRWRMVDFKRKVLRVSRMMNGLNSVHPLSRIEIQALRKLKKEYAKSSYLFMTDYGRALGKRTASRIIAEAAEGAGLKFPVSPRMLRRGCGHALADAGHNMVALQHYLGHRDIRHTLRYMELPSQPFRDFWKD